MTERGHSQRLREYRIRGFDDGYSGRAARATAVEYQRAWRRGRAARERDLAELRAERTGGAA